MTRDVNLVPHHRLDPKQQIRERDFFLHFVGFAIKRVLAVARQIQHRFAHRLARDGADVHAYAADDRLALDYHHALAKLGGLDCGRVAGRPGTDYHQIVLILSHDEPPELILVVAEMST